ncbi:unnamed protein product [Anisakis simplex]|uniref:mannose-6-phosphate isomerase n=1 Tax=Anisakis simplex TaxID=6269 RepID=A0A0M3JS38_ANISI|nr:unnamed protein product [Anisakis simplex]
MKPEKLVCKVQNYEWGRLGSDSLVASLKHSAQSDFAIDCAKPYAELWMGVHPNGPSMLLSNGESLSKFIESNKSSLSNHENGTLQFLFKVLSVNKALSIQSHPTKEQAKELRARDPAHYPDDNHKPEMAIALTDFQLLCGFRPSDEIFNNIKATPELLSLIKNSDNVLNELKTADDNGKRVALKQLFTDIMKSESNIVRSSIETMITRIKKKDTQTALDNLLIRLHDEFPGDVGIFSALLLNYYTLKKGESVYLGPNQPHAYLFGDCIECMACSDNTIRAGLTPKFKDVDTLCSNLTFQMSPPPYFKPRQLSESVVEYAPPVHEFAVHQIKKGESLLWNVYASSIMIVVSGHTELMIKDKVEMQVNVGEVVFIAADCDAVHVQNTSDDFIAYRAFTPIPK